MGSVAGPLLRLRVPLRGVRGRRRLLVSVGDRVRRTGLRHDLVDRDVRLPRLPCDRVVVRRKARGAHMGLIPVTIARTPQQRAEIGIGQQIAPEPMRFLLNWGRKYSLWVF